MTDIRIAALYHFARLDDYRELQAPLLDKCLAEDIRGTLLLAEEGINGTIAGTAKGRTLKCPRGPRVRPTPDRVREAIFSIIGEEVGLVGVLIIIALYGLILIKGIQIARNAPDTFGSLLAFGLTTAMGLQICINMGVALGLLPTKGLTLPFLSYGGTSLVISMASVGILLNIAANGDPE